MPYYKRGLIEGELKSNGDVVQQLISVIRQRNYSPRTMEAYTKWVRNFLKFNSGEIINIDASTARKYLNHLAIVESVSPSAQIRNLMHFSFYFAIS